MQLTLNGIKFEITNFDEFKKTILNALGFQLVNEVRKEIDRMKLVDTGYLRRIQHKVADDGIILWSDAPYAIYIEYGTFDYWKKFGTKSFPVPGYPAIPKKKEISEEERAKLPKGMQPFAPFRRVLYSDKRISLALNNAMKTL